MVPRILWLLAMREDLSPNWGKNFGGLVPKFTSIELLLLDSGTEKNQTVF